MTLNKKKSCDFQTVETCCIWHTQHMTMCVWVWTEICLRQEKKKNFFKGLFSLRDSCWNYFLWFYPLPVATSVSNQLFYIHSSLSLYIPFSLSLFLYVFSFSFATSVFILFYILSSLYLHKSRSSFHIPSCSDFLSLLRLFFSLVRLCQKLRVRSCLSCRSC